MPASLTSVDEVMRLAGTHHITVSPPLLTELATTPTEGWPGAASVGKALTAADTPVSDAEVRQLDIILHDESQWRLAFTRSDDGKSETKLIQAINIFCDMQERLEGISRKMNPAAAGTS